MVLNKELKWINVVFIYQSRENSPNTSSLELSTLDHCPDEDYEKEVEVQSAGNEQWNEDLPVAELIVCEQLQSQHY